MDLDARMKARLPFNGPVQLVLGGRTVRLRRRALAILYLLAVNGPLTRAELALWVWGRKSARQNLRVELHHLRERLAEAGLPPLEQRGDRLALPPGVALDRGRGVGVRLSGLEGLSPGLDEWVAEQRRVPEGGPPLVAGLPEQLLRSIEPPFLVLVEAGPLFEHRAFARELSRRVGLPFLGDLGDRMGVHLLPLRPREEEVEAALRAERAVWVVPVNALGEEGRHVLRLRSRWPPERVLYLRPDRVSWGRVRAAYPRVAPDRLASDYLESGGEASLLRERVGSEGAPRRRVQAAYLAEARHLTQAARLFVEGLSPYPGPIPEQAIEALGGGGWIEELERKRWLVLEDGWSFASEAARRALDRSLQPGRRRRAVVRLQRALARRGEPLAGAYLETLLGKARPDSPPPGLFGWARAVWLRGQGFSPVLLPRGAGGGELLLEPPRSEGWVGDQGELEAVGFGPPYRVRTAVFEPLEANAWFRLRGEVFAENLLGVGGNGDRLPLAVRVGGETVLALADLAGPLAVEGVLVAPLGAFDYQVWVPAGRALSLAAGFERGVVSLRIAAHRAGAGPGGSRVTRPA